jgi:hypothetical protein
MPLVGARFQERRASAFLGVLFQAPRLARYHPRTTARRTRSVCRHFRVGTPGDDVRGRGVRVALPIRIIDRGGERRQRFVGGNDVLAAESGTPRSPARTTARITAPRFANQLARALVGRSPPRRRSRPRGDRGALHAPPRRRSCVGAAASRSAGKRSVDCVRRFRRATRRSGEERIERATARRLRGLAVHPISASLRTILPARKVN